MKYLKAYKKNWLTHEILSLPHKLGQKEEILKIKVINNVDSKNCISVT